MKLEQSPDTPVALKHNLGHDQEFFVKIGYQLQLKNKFKKLQGKLPHLIRIVSSEWRLRPTYGSREEQSLSLMNSRETYGDCLTSESHLIYHKLLKTMREAKGGRQGGGENAHGKRN